MDNKTLSIEGIVSNSTELNKVSTELNDICTGLYSTITGLRDAGQFVSVTASDSYFESIDNLNQMVPKFTEAILRFSRFLSDYVLQNYTEVDEELHSKIESNLAESLAGLTSLGVISATGIDYSKIASTAQGALNGDFISSDKIYRKSFEQEGALDFATRDDGSILITKDGVPIGFTITEGIQDASNLAGQQAQATSGSHVPREVQNMIPKSQGGSVEQASTNGSQGMGQVRADAYDSRVSSTAGQQAQVVSGSYVPREVQNMISQSQNSSVAATIGTGIGAMNVNLNQLNPEINSNGDTLFENFTMPQQNQSSTSSLLDQFSIKPSNQSNLDSLLSDFDLNVQSKNK